MKNTAFSTLTACREHLTSQGYRVTTYQGQDGRRYLVSNFRGGRCFEGTLQQLKAELTAGWLRYS